MIFLELKDLALDSMINFDRSEQKSKDEEEIAKILIRNGKDLFDSPRSPNNFTNNPDADQLLNNIDKFPHAFVLACIMDRQVKAERAWMIPYLISKDIGGYEFESLLDKDLKYFEDIFEKQHLHRFNDIMPKIYYAAVRFIHEEYNDDASNIWKGKPKSATIVRRLLKFEGVGAKISTMTANILVRDFKIPVLDRMCIDISPDVHVKRVFRRIGFIDKNSSNEELIYCARELNPDYPGILDLSTWQIGRKWCKPKNPDCNNCYLLECCPKIL
jgi:endonuclease III